MSEYDELAQSTGAWTRPDAPGDVCKQERSRVARNERRGDDAKQPTPTHVVRAHLDDGALVENDDAVRIADLSTKKEEKEMETKSVEGSKG
jgi:hypothetical protein